MVEEDSTIKAGILNRIGATGLKSAFVLFGPQCHPYINVVSAKESPVYN